MPTAQKPATILFAFSFLASSSYVMMRALAVSLFLARIGPDSLAAALAVSALVAAGASLSTQAFMRKRSTARCASISWLLMALASCVLAVTVSPFHHSVWVLGGLFVLAEVRSCLGTMYAVSLSSESFSGSESKHPFAVVSSGAPIAGIVVGLVLGFEASLVQAAPILFLIAMLDIVTAGLTWWSRPSLADAKKKIAATHRHRRPRRRRSMLGSYRFRLSALVALKIVALTLIAFQWKVEVAHHYGADEAALMAFFALFYACSDVLIVMLQWLVSGRLLDRFGLGLALVGFPILAALVGLTLFVSPAGSATLVVLTIGSGLSVLRRSIHDPALTAAYAVLRPEVRRDTIVLVKGVIKPFAEAVTAVALIVSGAALLDGGLTVVWLGVVALWLGFAVGASRAYRSVLARMTAR